MLARALERQALFIQDDKSATLGCNNDQTLFVPSVFGICSKDSNAMKSSNPHSGIYKAETSRTLDANGGNPSCNQGGMVVVALEGNGARPSHKGSGYSEDNVSFTLNTTDRHGVAAVDCRNLYETDEVSGTLQSKNGGGYSLNYQNPIRRGYKVRRLTPTECERLQGFPDGWTDGHSDTVRYKALGNSVAVPCVEFVMRGIARVLETGE